MNVSEKIAIAENVKLNEKELTKVSVTTSEGHQTRCLEKLVSNSEVIFE